LILGGGGLEDFELVKCPPEQAETTVKCPAIGVVLVLEFWLKLNLTRRLLRRSHWPENNEIRAMVQKAGI
jgi:hypothetical protein